MKGLVLFTIGSSNRSADEFVELLKKYKITRLLDIRSKTGSRTLHFDEKRYGNLSTLLKKHGIAYDDSLHIVLGGLQEGKMTVSNFRRYAKSASFKKGLSTLTEIVHENDGRVVIMCCERDPKQCHRSIVAEALDQEGWLTHHLV